MCWVLALSLWQNLVSHMRGNEAKRDKSFHSELHSSSMAEIWDSHLDHSIPNAIIFLPSHLVFCLVHFEWGWGRHEERREGERSTQETAFFQMKQDSAVFAQFLRQDQLSQPTFIPQLPPPSSTSCVCFPALLIPTIRRYDCYSNYYYIQVKRHKSKYDFKP